MLPVPASTHIETMQKHKASVWTIEEDLHERVSWSQSQLARNLTDDEVRDIRQMLSVRGVLPAPSYVDEPVHGPRGLKGGGGRTQNFGMRAAPAAKRIRRATKDDEYANETAPADTDQEKRFGLTDDEPAKDVATTMSELMEGDICDGWHCDILGKYIGKAVLPPTWYMVLRNHTYDRDRSP